MYHLTDIIKLAEISAKTNNYYYIGTEHILLGILELIKLEVQKRIIPENEIIEVYTFLKTSRVNSMLERIKDEATIKDIFSELINDEGGVAFEVLKELGF